LKYYIAAVEKEPGKSVEVWFPDLSGCFSGGDTIDEAMANAPEALVLYAGAMAESGSALPPARSLTELKDDPEAAADLREHMVALIPFKPSRLRPAAE